MECIISGKLQNESDFYPEGSVVYVTVNLSDLESEVESYTIKNLDMGREDDFEDDPYNCQDEQLIQVLENRGHTLMKNVIFDKKMSINEASAYNTLLTNIDNIPLEEIEKINNKYNLINYAKQNIITFEK